jgi:tripartite-type tricarboxylate transporter receptor subunit TctC
MWRRATVAFAACLAATAAEAGSVAEFYAGKQINLYIGSSAGGGYDAYARLVARHIGSHIPGHPAVVPQNMPGAGQTRAAGYVFAVAAKDGTAMAAISPGSVLQPILGGPKIQYDPSKFQFIGSANEDIYTCIARPDAPVKTFAETFDKELIVGVSSGTTRDMPTVLVNILGAKLKLVTGYPGTKEITLALQRNEVQGICGFGYASLVAQYPDWIPSGVVKVLLQESAKGHPDLTNAGVPLATSFAKTPEDKQALELIYSQGVAGRPFVVAPEVPKDRVDALRAAFTAAMKDPQLLADAAKMNLEVSPMSGEDVQALMAKVFAASPEVVERARKAIDVKE